MKFTFNCVSTFLLLALIKVPFLVTSTDNPPSPDQISDKSTLVNPANPHGGHVHPDVITFTDTPSPSPMLDTYTVSPDVINFTDTPSPGLTSDNYIPVGPPESAFIVSLRTHDPGNDTVAFTPPTYINTIVTNPDQGPDNYTYFLENWIKPDDWLAALEKEANSGPILIFIHGFNNLAPAAVTRYIAVRDGMSHAGGNVTVVCFDWASGDSGLYNTDHATAVASGHYLVDLIALINEFSTNINILTHSMGGYVVQNALANPPNSSRMRPINNVMMAEADVLKLSFDYESGPSGVTNLRRATPTSVLSCFMKLVKNLTVYWSNYDLVLKVAPAYDFINKTHWTSCGQAEPLSTDHLARLGFTGMTLSSEYINKTYNVGYSQYYEQVYSNEPTFKDSHVWPILGSTNNPKPAGDSAFMTDVWEVVNHSQNFTSREKIAPHDYIFTVPPTEFLH